MDDASLKASLASHFGPSLRDPSLLAECLSILRLYALPAEELFFKWEAFVLNHLKSGAVFNLESARELKKEIAREHSVAAAAASTSKAKTTPGLAGIKRNSAATGLDQLLGNFNTPGTPLAKRPRPSATPSTSRPLPVSTPSRTPGFSVDQATPRQMPMLGRPNFSTPVVRVSNGVLSSPGTFESPSAATPSSSKAFASRTDALRVTDTLNPQLAAAKTPAIPYSFEGKSRVKLQAEIDPENFAYRYMFEKVTERAEILNSRIDTFGEMIREYYGLSEDFTDPSETNEEPVYVVGQIHSDSLAKINETSLLIQPSRIFGGGRRTPLQFAPDVSVRGEAPGVEGTGLFPGAVMAFKGRNGSGGWFTVEEILLPPTLDVARTEASKILHFQHGPKLGGQPVSLYTACGPFTLDNDLDYAPMDVLMEELKTARPDVVILLGPFIDSAHPLIKKGAVDKTPEALFRSQIAKRLKEHQKLCPATKFFLVPSLRDLVSSQICFPQGMLNGDELGLPWVGQLEPRLLGLRPKSSLTRSLLTPPFLSHQQPFQLVSNPCVFRINEVAIAVTSVDTFFHLRREILFKSAREAEPEPGAAPQKQDIMATVMRSMISQRTFYPLYPVPATNAADVNLDLTHFDKMAFETIPDIVISPSNLAKFAKAVDGVVFINPGRLAQRAAGGTFARINVHPLNRERLVAQASAGTQGEEAWLEHDVAERVRVDIVKI